MKMDEKTAVKRLIAQYESLATAKSTRLSYWQSLHEYTFSHKAALTQAFTMASRPHAEKFDSAGMLNAARCAASMYTHLTPSSQWFLLAASPGSEAAADRGYTDSLADRAEQLHLAFAQTNFATEMHSAYEDLLSGTACVSVKKQEARPFSLSTRPLGEYCFACNDEGVPEVVFVERQLTAFEAADLFGTEKLSPPIQKALKDMADSVFTDKAAYLNVMKPNDKNTPASIASDAPYENLWIERAGGKVIQRGGNKRLRYIISRFWKPTGMDWGMGPSDMAYPSIRCVDKFMEVVLKYAAKAMNPPSLWPDDGAFHPMSTAPGAVIMGRMGAGDLGHPQLMQLATDHRLAQYLLEYYGNQIAQCYFAQIFQTLADSGQKTAYEVATVLQKDYDLAIPVVGRQQRELFAPLVRVCLELMTEWELGIHGWKLHGETLGDYDYQLELISPLALAIKYQELQKLPNLIALLSPLAEMDPSVWDHYSLKDISHAIGESMGVPKSWKRSRYEVRRIADARHEAQAREQFLQSAQAAASAAKDASGPVAADSVLRGVA